jgi:PPOX class probable F420-dependent enzyme
MTSIEGRPELVDLLADQHNGVLVTIKADGRPQLSNVTYVFDRDIGVIKVSITADRAKYRNLLRDPRVSLHVTPPRFWPYTVAEGDAELSAVAADRNDPTVEELIEVYRDANGEHPDWDDYRRAMVADKRVVLRIPVKRVYGVGPQG